MITKISIENYKSITKLDFSPGRFNILIGENGGGKSNLLEAISFGVAASLDKLDNEFLGLRGIRVTEPQFVMSSFENNPPKEIVISFLTDRKTSSIICRIDPKTKKAELFAGFPISGNAEAEPLSYETISHIKNILSKEGIYVNKLDIRSTLAAEAHPFYGKVDPELGRFVFYCPEESALRTFRDEYQLLPLGRKGEGVFKYLKELSQSEEGKLVLNEINENLSLLDWFDHIEVPATGLSNDYTVYIKDRYLTDTMSYFDQRSTNEGFLYLLFYFTLFISKDTPVFFAIDNIESSFNPKLCTKIIEVLQKLAVKHNKQVILTTHNPFILDGLDLSDEDQRLFVVRRNDEGHTKIRHIEYKPERKKKLSELWMSGAIGGLPDNF